MTDEKQVAVMADHNSVADHHSDLQLKGDHTVQNPHIEAFLAMSPEERAATEKKLLRKMDLRLIPWMT